MVEKTVTQNRKFLDKVNFFNFLTLEQKDAIAGRIISLKYLKGENIVNEGDQADSFYMIM